MLIKLNSLLISNKRAFPNYYPAPWLLNCLAMSGSRPQPSARCSTPHTDRWNSEQLQAEWVHRSQIRLDNKVYDKLVEDRAIAYSSTYPPHPKGSRSSGQQIATKIDFLLASILWMGFEVGV